MTKEKDSTRHILGVGGNDGCKINAPIFSYIQNNLYFIDFKNKCDPRDYFDVILSPFSKHA